MTRIAGQTDLADSAAAELVTWAAPPDGGGVVTIETDELTALCPGTGRPDFYTLQVRYQPNRMLVETQSLKLFLGSFRDRHIGVEYLAVELRDTLVTLLAPAALTVQLRQHVRGGLGTTVLADLDRGVRDAA